MPFAKDNDIVEALSSDRADQPLGISVLPRRTGRDRPIPKAHGTNDMPCVGAASDAPLAAQQTATMGATTPSRYRLGGFGMGMIAHDREAARQAFKAALALSPSCALTYIMGSVVMAVDGDADRAIEWASGRYARARSIR